MQVRTAEGDQVSWIGMAFERVSSTLRRKGRDYAAESDEFKNLRRSGARVGLDTVQSAIFYVEQKLTRWENLSSSDSPPANESIEDTLLDLAGYAMLAYAAYLQQQSIHEPEYQGMNMVASPWSEEVTP